jgi:hypothetical protein
MFWFYDASPSRCAAQPHVTPLPLIPRLLNHNCCSLNVLYIAPRVLVGNDKGPRTFSSLLSQLLPYGSFNDFFFLQTFLSQTKLQLWIDKEPSSSNTPSHIRCVECYPGLRVYDIIYFFVLPAKTFCDFFLSKYVMRTVLLPTFFLRLKMYLHHVSFSFNGIDFFCFMITAWILDFWLITFLSISDIFVFSLMFLHMSWSIQLSCSPAFLRN